MLRPDPESTLFWKLDSTDSGFQKKVLSWSVLNIKIENNYNRIRIWPYKNRIRICNPALTHSIASLLVVPIQGSLISWVNDNPLRVLIKIQIQKKN